MPRNRFLSRIPVLFLVIMLALTGCGTAEPTATPEPSNTPAPTDTPTPEPTATPSINLDEALALARAGVERNDDWIPYSRVIDGVEMALIPAGCFEPGSTAEEIADALDLCGTGCPSWERENIENEAEHEEVCFEEPFWIDRYEVTNAQYGSTGRFTGDQQPRESVTVGEALAHCEQRGMTLPGFYAWEYAARGPDRLIFPWGNDLEGRVPESFQTFDVGSIENDVSWVGAYDMGGNVQEWVVGTSGTQRHMLRGGTLITSDADMVYHRTAYAKRGTNTASNFLLGFRCARSVTGSEG